MWPVLVMHTCKLLFLYRENNAKVAADSEREELEIKLQTFESLVKKRDDELNSYKEEVRVNVILVLISYGFI